jgi:hypothetical protein
MHARAAVDDRGAAGHPPQRLRLLLLGAPARPPVKVYRCANYWQRCADRQQRLPTS